MTEDIQKIVKWAEEIQGQWDGDLPGRGEDRAGQAEDIIEACKNLQELIEGMDNL